MKRMVVMNKEVDIHLMGLGIWIVNLLAMKQKSWRQKEDYVKNWENECDQMDRSQRIHAGKLEAEWVNEAELDTVS